MLLVAAAILITEGLVRARQWLKSGTFSGYADLYVNDASLGLPVLRPLAHVGNINVNSKGFRGPELAEPKPEDVVRIAFLGASTTFCAEVSGDSAVWPNQVVEILRQRFPATRFDFVNGGVPGYTLASSRRQLEKSILPMKPDLIVVLPGTNDLSGEVRDMAIAQGLAKPSSPADQSWLARRSLLWELLAKNLRVIEAQHSAGQAEGARLKLNATALGGEFGPNLAAVLKEAVAHSLRVAVATFPTQLRRQQSADEQRRASVSAFVYMPFMSIDDLLAGYARHNEIVRQLAPAQGALLIEAENAIPGDPAYFVDTVHFTDKGSRAMAEIVAAALAADPATARLIESRRQR